MGYNERLIFLRFGVAQRHEERLVSPSFGVAERHNEQLDFLSFNVDVRLKGGWLSRAPSWT